MVARPGQRRPGQEKYAKSCIQCQAVKGSPPKAPLHPWMWPWQRIHVDFAGPFLGFLIVVDAHSKWPEVIEMSTTTSSKTIVELIFCLWVTRADCLRQWSSIHFRGVCNFSEAKWNPPHPLFSIPPFFKWSSRTFC